MHSMDSSIIGMYKKGYIDREEAIERSNDRVKMEQMLGKAK